MKWTIILTLIFPNGAQERSIEDRHFSSQQECQAEADRLMGMLKATGKPLPLPLIAMDMSCKEEPT
jgi:hypothetical protein